MQTLHPPPPPTQQLSNKQLFHRAYAMVSRSTSLIAYTVTQQKNTGLEDCVVLGSAPGTTQVSKLMARESKNLLLTVNVQKYSSVVTFENTALVDRRAKPYDGYVATDPPPFY